MDKLLLVIALCVLSFAGYYGYAEYSSRESNEYVELTLNREVVTAEVVRSNLARSRGLSGRESLPVGTGMLFVFPDTAYPSMWMKDMLFSIDILFISPDGTINTIFENISPETYFETPPRQFRTLELSRYVLELPAGTVADENIRTGMKVPELADFK